MSEVQGERLLLPQCTAVERGCECPGRLASARAALIHLYKTASGGGNSCVVAKVLIKQVVTDFPGAAMVLASNNSKCSCMAWHCVGWGWPGKTVILSLESLEILCKSILRTPSLLCNVCIYLSLDGNYM